MRHFRSKESILRESIRQILTEDAGAGKIDELIGRIEGINAQIAAQFDPEKLLEFGDDVGPHKFGVMVHTSGNQAEVAYAILGASHVGVLQPGKLVTISGIAESKLVKKALGVDVPYGKIEFGKNPSDAGKCSGAWSVRQTHKTTSGWGPLLYDIAIETATSIAGGLTSDRSEVSQDAVRVWSAYDQMRPDVEKAQLDLRDKDIERWGKTGEVKHLTPETTADDCTQWSSFEDIPRFAAGGIGSLSKWSNSPLSRVYRKPPTTTAALEARGILFEIE